MKVAAKVVFFVWFIVTALSFLAFSFLGMGALGMLIFGLPMTLSNCLLGGIVYWVIQFVFCVLIFGVFDKKGLL